MLNVLRALPEWCVEQIVNEYQNKREPETPKKREVVILSRDSFLRDMFEAGKQFVEHFSAGADGLKPEHLKLLQEGRTPYGWSPKFMRQHPQLERVCKVPTIYIYVYFQDVPTCGPSLSPIRPRGGGGRFCRWIGRRGCRTFA